MRKRKDHRYKAIKIMLDAGGIKTLQDIFKVLPRTVVAQDMHTNNNRFYRLINNPGDFTFNEVRQIAKLIGCRYTVLRELVERGMDD